MEKRYILNLNFARKLMREGFTIIDVETSRSQPGRVAFVFEATEELKNYLAKGRNA